MSDRPSWLRADLIVVIVLIVVIAIALVSPSWRSAGKRPAAPMSSGSRAAATKSYDTSKVVAPVTIDAPRSSRHRSPFDGAATARAESICVRTVESNLESQLGEPYVAAASDRYGVGDIDTGAGDSLDFDGTARSASGRNRVWHCGMANLGAFPGSPMITHAEGQ